MQVTNTQIMEALKEAIGSENASYSAHDAVTTATKLLEYLEVEVEPASIDEQQWFFDRFDDHFRVWTRIPGHPWGEHSFQIGRGLRQDQLDDLGLMLRTAEIAQNTKL